MAGRSSLPPKTRASRGSRQDGLERGEYVVLAVVDTGCGIAPEMLERVLEPFVTTKDIGKGTGLGLSMVYGFARQSRGAFRIDSEVGKGTRAEIWLPRSTMPVGTARGRTPCPGQEQPPAPRLVGRRSS